LAKSNYLSFQNNLWGIFPLALFVARLIELAWQEKTPHILWICHISSLVIALGLFSGSIEFVRVSVLWLVLGIPIWPIEIIRTGIMEITSIGTHYIALVFGLFLLRRLGFGKKSWLYALIWFLFLQQITRIFTPVELNVNLAHTVYPGWEQIFPHYWQYWLLTNAGSAFFLWATSKGLSWVFKRNQKPVIAY
jgi:hypothetical protein